MSKALKLNNRGKLEIPEADVQRVGDDLMQAHGWRCIPQPVTIPCRSCGQGVNVPGADEGQPDRLYIRPYAPWTPARAPSCSRVIAFVEYKKRGKKAGLLQLAYHEYLRKLGFTVLVWDKIEDVADWLGVKL